MTMFTALNVHQLAAVFLSVPCGDPGSIYPITIKGSTPKKVTPTHLFLASSFQDSKSQGDVTYNTKNPVLKGNVKAGQKKVISKREYMFLASSLKDQVVCLDVGQGDGTQNTKNAVKTRCHLGTTVDQNKKVVSKVEYMFLASGLRDQVICSDEQEDQPSLSDAHMRPQLTSLSNPKTKKASRWWRHPRRVKQT